MPKDFPGLSRMGDSPLQCLSKAKVPVSPIAIRRQRAGNVRVAIDDPLTSSMSIRSGQIEHGGSGARICA
jgi:hypothetical protein